MRSHELRMLRVPVLSLLRSLRFPWAIFSWFAPSEVFCAVLFRAAIIKQRIFIQSMQTQLSRHLNKTTSLRIRCQNWVVNYDIGYDALFLLLNHIFHIFISYLSSYEIILIQLHFWCYFAIFFDQTLLPSQKKGTKSVTGAAPFQKVPFGYKYVHFRYSCVPFRSK